MERGLAAAAALLGSLPQHQGPSPPPPPDAAGVPEWLRVARAEEAAGVAELPGQASNPRIEEYFTWTTLGEQPDGKAWCAAFLSFCLGTAGELRMGRGSARAANWLDWGETLAEPRPGCVVVLEPLAPGASGHVGFWVKEERGKIHLPSGNQGERVNVTAFPKRKLRQNEYRWPPDAEGARRSGGAPAAVARGAIARAKGRRPGRAKSLPGLVPEGPSRD